MPSTEAHKRAMQKYATKRRSRLKAAGLCVACGKMEVINNFAYCVDCQSSARKPNTASIKRAKDAVYAHYGSKCLCCGETDLYFLTIDHVNNDGNIDRRRGSNWYKKILKLGCPSNYQILCYNCNCGRYRNGGVCPHESKRQSSM